MVPGQLVFVLGVCGIHQKVEAAVIGVLHFGEEIGLPFCLLEDVRYAVSALGKTEIIEIGEAQIICREGKQVKQQSGADSVFAVVACVVMAAGNINGGEIGWKFKKHAVCVH